MSYHGDLPRRFTTEIYHGYLPNIFSFVRLYHRGTYVQRSLGQGPTAVPRGPVPTVLSWHPVCVPTTTYHVSPDHLATGPASPPRPNIPPGSRVRLSVPHRPTRRPARLAVGQKASFSTRDMVVSPSVSTRWRRAATFLFAAQVSENTLGSISNRYYTYLALLNLWKACSRPCPFNFLSI